MSETAVYIDDDQFDGRSTDKCGFEIEAMIYYATAPGSANPNTASQIHSLASTDYVQLNGADVLSNTSGMVQSQLDQLLVQHQSKIHAALSKNQLDYRNIATDWTTIRAWIAQGFPVIVCVPESQVFDEAVGGVPYPWATYGYNHVILASGLSQDDNSLLFRDTANITAPNTLRPGPRTYKTSLITPWWATVVFPSWLPVPSSSYNPIITNISEEEVMTLSIDQAKNYFTAQSATNWKCMNGFSIADGILAFYCAYGNKDLCGLSYLGLPLSNEIYPTSGIAVQLFERGIVVYDPSRKLDNPPGTSESCYLMHIDGGIGNQLVTQKVTDPLKSQLTQAQEDLKTAQANLATAQSQAQGYQSQIAELQQTAPEAEKMADALAQIGTIATSFNVA